MIAPVLLWFRRDLRLQDNTALHSALQANAPIIPVFIFDLILLKSDRVGAPRVKFMLAALASLDEALQKHGAGLLIRHGKPLEILRELVQQTEATALFFNRDYSPYATQRDNEIETKLGIPVHSYDDAIIMPPNAVLKPDGKPYTVFTPYKNSWNKLAKRSLQESQLSKTTFTHANLTSEPLPTLKKLGFEETIDVPEASEAFAHDLLKQFLNRDLRTYSHTRNNLTIHPFAHKDIPSTSFLSPYLRLGLLSPRECYWAAHEVYANNKDSNAHASIATWVSELTWRDFYMQILLAFPHVMQRNFVETYDELEWRDAPEELEAWKNGMTGYPIVDAPMRQMNAVGWMPNRARMVVASFLTKHLLIHWIHGDKYFMQRLLDGDPAANNGGWQWSAGTGTDAQPYFRIFNPMSQSEKFADPTYLRHWLPELKNIDDKFIHTPWLAPTLPKDYPAPIVEHDFARQRTLEAFKKARGEKEKPS